MKFFNNKYKNIIYKNKEWRLYNELTTNSIESFYSETQILIIELMQKFNFELFLIKTNAKTNFEVEFLEKDVVNKKSRDIQKIKYLLYKDILFFYENKFFELMYKIPYLTKNNNYYYDILLLVDKNFNLDKIYKHNFNLINIISINKIDKSEVTFEFIENLFKKKSDFSDRAGIDSINETYFYDIRKTSYSRDEYIENYCNGNWDKYNVDQYWEISSFYKINRFNQNDYINNFFRFLDMSILSFGKKYVIKKNNGYLEYSYINIYDFNSAFLTNFDEIVESTKLTYNSKNELKVLNNSYTYSCILDNIYYQNIAACDLDKNLTKIGFVDLKNLDIIDLSFLDKNKIEKKI